MSAIKVFRTLLALGVGFSFGHGDILMGMWLVTGLAFVSLGEIEDE